MLSIWFWATIIAGGVLTIDAPYAARLVGIIPCMAIFAAIVVNKLAAEFMGVASRVILRPVVSRRMAVLASSGALLALLGYLTVLNFNDYFVRYLDPHPFNEVTGQAYFVRQMNKQATDEGRPTPMYYDLGAQFIFWTHGDNRFLNNGTNGRDMSNPADSLPLLDNDDRDAVFMIWPVNMQYLPILKAYYPNGEEGKFIYGPPGKTNPLFIYYRVKKEQIDVARATIATYAPASGPAVERQESNFGTTNAPPNGLTYPVRVTWSGQTGSPGLRALSLPNRRAGRGGPHH